MNIYTLNISKNLTSYKKSIQQIVHSTFEKVQGKISLKPVEIVIKETDKPELYKDIDGIGAYCPSGDFIQLNIDSKHPAIKKSPKQVVEKSLIHELHHAARRQAGIKIDKSTFLECLFSEGLADYFVYELTGKLPKWIIELDDKKRLLKLVKSNFSKKMTKKLYNDWFIVGSKKDRIPKFAGYVIGFEIVKNYLAKNSDESVGSLIKIPVEKIKIHK